MKKTALFTALIAAAGVASTTAQAAPTLYGEVGASLQVDLAKDKPNETNTIMDLKSRKARIGVKGDQPIDDGMKAVYKVELDGDFIRLDVDKTTGKDANNDTVKLGGRYMGLEGGFGTVLIGGKLGTAMDDTVNDVNVANKLVGFDSSNSGSRGKHIKYTSPNFSGIKVGVSLLPHAAKDDKGKDKNGSFGFSGAVSYEQNGIYAAFAFESGASSRYFETKNAKQPTGMRVVGKLTMIENLQLGLIYDKYTLDKFENNTILASASYSLGSITPRFQVISVSHDSNNKATAMGVLVGANYKIADKVGAYSDFGYTSKDSGASGSKADNTMQLDFGLKVKF